jgi:CRP/FNR family transcriptional regulator
MINHKHFPTQKGGPLTTRDEMKLNENSQAEEIFSKVAYFKGLDRRVIQAVARESVLRSYHAEEVVIIEGEPVPGLFIIQSGWLKAVKIGLDGREQVLEILGPGEVFHAIGVFTDTVSPASVSALEDCQLFLIRREVMQRLLDEYPGLAQRVIQDLARRVLHLVDLVEDLSLRSVEARLAHLLLEQAQDGKVQRKRWATQEEMARRLGTVPDVLNRLLRKMVENGIVQVDRQQITILDKDRLEDLAFSK